MLDQVQKVNGAPATACK